MCHWIASNVSLSQKTFSILPMPFFGAEEELKESKSGPESLIDYKPPGPPPKTGKHRYVFLAFAPKNGTSEPLDLEKPKERQHWGAGEERKGVREWAGKNGLVPVGKSVWCVMQGMKANLEQRRISYMRRMRNSELRPKLVARRKGVSILRMSLGKGSSLG